MTRTEIEEGRAWAHRLLGKPELAVAERKTTEAERVAAWLARCEAERDAGTQTRPVVEQTRRDLHTPGSAFAVGGERYAADGTLWRRTA